MPQREPALLWLRDFALTALVLALCTLTSWVFFRLDFVSYWEPSSFTLGTCYLFNQTDPYKSWLASDLCEPFPPVFIVSSSLSTFLFRKFLFT